jgi:uncharacterized protein YjlB
MLTSHTLLKSSGWVPNNAVLPVLIYRREEADDDESPDFERLFSQNGWQGIWHNGVFDYHHYHSGAHEVLGVAAGSAQLQIGGADGPVLTVSRGDCLVLPAGTGHKKLESTENFSVVGAYPPGQHAEILRSAPSVEQQTRIERLPLPHSDPLQGTSGFLIEAWKPD